MKKKCLCLITHLNAQDVWAAWGHEWRGSPPNLPLLTSHISDDLKQKIQIKCFMILLLYVMTVKDVGTENGSSVSKLIALEGLMHPGIWIYTSLIKFEIFE